MKERKTKTQKEQKTERNIQENNDSLMKGHRQVGDDKEIPLRPHLLKEFQGQTKIKENFSIFITTSF